MTVDSVDQMIREQIIARGIRNERVLAAMRAIDRKLFVPASFQEDAYSDGALPVMDKATISQPYVVALMTELLDLQPDDKVLEIGCGTGYQTAILAYLAREVWSLEIIPDLAGLACARLQELGVLNAHVINRSGWEGLPEQAPFHKIIVTAGPDKIPAALRDQLAPGGIMVIPVGDIEQDLLVVTKDRAGKISERNIAPVRFVPMVRRRDEDS